MKQYTVTIGLVVEAETMKEAKAIADDACQDCKAYSCADHAYVEHIEKEEEE